ncbi:acyltransferase family protein [Rubrivivax gelatinosus]
MHAAMTLVPAVEPRVRPRPAGDRIAYVHDFRGLAVLFIVTTHTLSLFDWSANPELARVLKYLVANGTTFFLFISGFLFEYLKGRYEVLDYWDKKLRFVVLPYLIVSAPALVAFVFLAARQGMPAGFEGLSDWQQMGYFLITGKHLAPFWFIPTIVSFYLVSPLILHATRDDRAFWALPLLFVLPAFVGRSDNPLLNVVHFLPVWALGMLMCRFRQTAEPLLKRHLWQLLALSVALGIAELAFTRGTHTYLDYLQKTVLILFLVAALLRLGSRATPWLGWAGTLSFGIFFVHSYVITAFKFAFEYGFGQLPGGGVPQLLLAAAAAALASALLVKAVIRLLGRRSRYVIGV